MKDRSNFDGDLPIPEYVEKNMGKLAECFEWEMDKKTGDYRNHMNRYNTIIEVFRRHGNGIGIAHWEPWELKRTVEKAQKEGYPPGYEMSPYADSTVQGWWTFLRRLYRYAANVGDSPDKVEYLDKLKKHLPKIDLSPNKSLTKRREECAEIFKQKRNAKRSLTTGQLQLVIEKATELLPTQGLGLAILVLAYTGLRPSEVLGLKVGDYLRYVQYEGHFLSVTRQVHANGSIKNRLKRNASYRKIPVSHELEAQIEARISLIRKHLPEGVNIEQCPLCSWGNNFMQHSRPCRLSTLARDLLTGASVEDQVYMNAFLDMYMTEPEMNKPEAEEFDCHTYLLRHTFWTMLQSSCELSADEKRVIFGHAVWHDGEEYNAGYNYEELLWSMHQKLQHIVFYPPAHRPFMVETLRSGRGVVRGNIGELTLTLPIEELKQNGARVSVRVISLKRGDPIVVDILKESVDFFGDLTPMVNIRTVPWPALDDKSLTCDLNGWISGQRHMEKRSKKMEE